MNAKTSGTTLGKRAPTSGHAAVDDTDAAPAVDVGVRTRRDGRDRRGLPRPFSATAWRVAAAGETVSAVIVVALAGLFAVLWRWGSFDTAPGPTTYPLRELLKDGADVVLKVGAVAAGLLGMYRYWYQRYEPLVYFTSCGLIPKGLLEEIQAANPQFRAAGNRPRIDGDADRGHYWHALPIVILHRHTMDLLGLHDGAQVDLEFTRPDATKVWAHAFAFAFPGPHDDDERRPIALSYSLRQLFGIERPHPGISDVWQRDDAPRVAEGCGADAPPPWLTGWHVVRANGRDLFPFGERAGDVALWLVSNEYCTLFRDGDCLDDVHPDDDLVADRGRVIEYAGISLRVYRRSALRYRG